jgi:hypothetical protein
MFAYAFLRVVIGNDTAPGAISHFSRRKSVRSMRQRRPPDKPGPSFVRRNDERVARRNRFGLEVGDCAEGESAYNNIAFAVESTAGSRPLRHCSLRPASPATGQISAQPATGCRPARPALDFCTMALFTTL